MPKKAELNDVEALDMLKNEIADYVVDGYCNKDCPYMKDCTKGKECRFNLAIERTIRLIHRQERKIRELYKEIGDK